MVAIGGLGPVAMCGAGKAQEFFFATDPPAYLPYTPSGKGGLRYKRE
jgi:hypothetical protein